MQNTEIQVIDLKITDVILVKLDMQNMPKTMREEQAKSIKELIRSVFPINKILVVDSSRIDIGIISPGY